MADYKFIVGWLKPDGPHTAEYDNYRSATLQFGVQVGAEGVTQCWIDRIEDAKRCAYWEAVAE